MPARVAHEAEYALVQQNPAKFFYAGRMGPFKWQLAGIPGNQVHLGAQIGDQLNHPPGVFGRIVDSTEQDILEQKPFSRPQRIFPAGIEQFFERIFAIDRHDFVALLVG